MKIKSVSLKGFKRFTDLTINNIPQEAKLIVLVGPNGVGKSSLFDAFNLYLWRSKDHLLFSKDYHIKSSSLTTSSEDPTYVPPANWRDLLDNVKVQFHGPDQLDPSQPGDRFLKAFYIRTSYRNESDFKKDSVTRPTQILLDERRPDSLAATDKRVSDNFGRIIATAVGDIFDEQHDTLTAKDIRDRLIGEIGGSLTRVLPELSFEGAGDPFEEGTFLFRKGISRRWRYINLSGGEKAAFDLLLDFIIKKQTFNDTVFCIDEPEAHMSTRAQADLLRELYAKLPTNSQLWIATHSIGMMHMAMELYQQDPSSVVFLDFGGKDFDHPLTLVPEIPTRRFWKRQLGIAMGDLSSLLAPRRIVFCEGNRDAEYNPSFDAKCYNTIFELEFPDTEFVSVGGSGDIGRNGTIIRSVLETMLTGMSFLKLYDLDDRNEGEVKEIVDSGGCVLARRDIESYLYDDEILTALCQAEGKAHLTKKVLAEKAKLMADLVNKGKHGDDVKAVSGPLANQIKITLEMTQRGNSAQAFAIGNLAPLVKPGTKSYAEMKEAIFG